MIHCSPLVKKTDLHRHLDGNIRLSTILDLAAKHGISLPATNAEALRPFVTVTEPQPGLVEFLDKFRWSISVLADTDACRRVAYENMEDAAREQLDYVELRFSPFFMAKPFGLDPQAVVAAVLDGVVEGAEKFGVPARVIGILSRTFGPDSCARELDALLACREGLVAIDLAGDEFRFPPKLFKECFDRVRDAGLRVTIHAGEAAGPDSVREAIEILGAERIGHGIRSIEDDALMDQIIRQKIGLECCLTSNVQTSTVRDYASHPLREFLDLGIIACINTDDPGISAVDLQHELSVAAPAARLTPEHIALACANAERMAFGPV
jgi:adenosine deaminase